MRKIKINFVDFWPNFNKYDNYFYNLLSQKYEVVIDEIDPELLFFSVDYSKKKEREKYKNHDCKKIFFTGENISPNFTEECIEYSRYSIGKADFSFTFQNLENRNNYRLPLWVLFINWFNVKHSETRDQSYLIPLKNLFNRQFTKKIEFCNFVFSNNQGKRLEILQAIQKYKKVNSCGKLANNSNIQIKGRGDQKHKILFLRDYKFTIASENTDSPGYTTEKMIHPLSVGSIPIYWGSSTVHNDFNKDCFININSFNSLEEAVEQIKEIDNNKALYKKYIESDIFPNGKIPEFADPKNVLKYFEENIL